MNTGMEMDWQKLLDKFRQYAAEAPAPAAAGEASTGSGKAAAACEASLLAECGVFARYRDATFANIEARGVPVELREQVDTVRDYAEHLELNVRQGFGLLLRGPVGTMKTSLAVAVMQYWLQQGGHAFFLTMPSLMDSIFSAKATSPEDWNRFETKLRQVPLLVLDDLGTEWPGGWGMTKVDAIFSERYNRQRSTIVTTNLGGAEMKSRYADRIIDRLRATTHVITCNTPESLRESCR